MMAVAVGLVLLCGSFVPGFIEGFRGSTAESTVQFGKSLAKRLQTRLAAHDDAFLAHSGDRTSLTMIKNGRERLERTCGRIERVEFLRMTNQNRVRYGPQKKFVAAELRVSGPKGSSGLSVKSIRDERHKTWFMAEFVVHP